MKETHLIATEIASGIGMKRHAIILQRVRVSIVVNTELVLVVDARLEKANRGVAENASGTKVQELAIRILQGVVDMMLLNVVNVRLTQIQGKIMVDGCAMDYAPGIQLQNLATRNRASILE
mmetsp:Transcript_11688/g.23283  ORF Transcript_11688/g.23283 Transcript_11688/m.23283 type:complete len:121 (+) Transcript_11688:915-1277(+)